MSNKILHSRINKNSRNLLIALSLGDGCITKDGAIYVNHSWKQYGYSKWLYNLLKRNGIRVGKFSRFEGSNGYLKHTIQYRFSVSRYDFNKVIRRCLYKDGKKYYNPGLLRRLDPQGLAIWFMDDGSILRRKYKGKYCGFYLRISTYCSLEEINEIIKYFNEVWDIYPTKVKERRIKNYDAYTLNFGAKESKKLVNIIKPYMCPYMMYKVLYDVEECKKYYNVEDMNKIFIDGTLESDRMKMEMGDAHKSEDIV